MRRKESLRKEREERGEGIRPDPRLRGCFEEPGGKLWTSRVKLKRTFSVSSLISCLLLIVALLDDHIKQRFGQSFK